MKKAQIWIENVIYILIGLGIIATILSLSLPQIDKVKDRGIIKQTLIALEDIDYKLEDIVSKGPANMRMIQFQITKGNLKIDGANDQLVYILDNTRLEYSEPGQEIRQGNFKIMTSRNGARYRIEIYRKYNLDILNGGDNGETIINAGPTPRKISIKNQGQDEKDGEKKIKINFEVIN